MSTFNPHQSYWLNSVNDTFYPSLEKDITVDVGIVGGGITGITAAYLLAKAGLNVCVVDAKYLFHGTTGYTTAKITAQHGLIYADLIDYYGEEFALKYYEANCKAQAFIFDTIHSLNIDCYLTESDAILYTNDVNELSKLANEQKAYEKLHIAHEFTDQLQTAFPLKQALIMKNQASFHPLLYLQALLQECEKAGVQIYEQTQAVHIDYANQPQILLANNKRIICKYVIQASHYPFFDGAKFFPVKMYASRSYVIAIKPNEQHTDGMYINIEKPTRSLRPITIDDETALLISGENHKTGQSDVPMKEHYNALLDFAKEHFGVKELLYQWSAQDYTTLDKVPYVGQMTPEQKHVFVATGFNKWGMTNGTNAALLISDLILERENPYVDIFSPTRTLKVNPTITNFITYNLDVAKHLIKGKLQPTDKKLQDLRENGACVISHAGQKIGVYKDETGKLYAVDTTCTHLGCEVVWNDAENSWDCPCHGSRFAYDGSILNGPADQPLQRVNLSKLRNF